MGIAFVVIILFVVFVVWKYIVPLKSGKFKKKYICDNGRFVAKGNKDQFIIKKNKYYEFLVIDGTIVACKDLRVSKEFVYYEGGIFYGDN